MIPTDAQVEAFGEAWHAAGQRGKPGDRRRAGLGVVLTDIEKQIEALPIDYLTSRWIDRASVLAIVRGEKL